VLYLVHQKPDDLFGAFLLLLAALAARVHQRVRNVICSQERKRERELYREFGSQGCDESATIPHSPRTGEVTGLRGFPSWNGTGLPSSRENSQPILFLSFSFFFFFFFLGSSDPSILVTEYFKRVNRSFPLPPACPRRECGEDFPRIWKRQSS